VLDAVRVEDNKPVVIKRVQVGSDEVAICRMLSSPELRKNPHNHAVPVLDYFAKDGESQRGFLVMPLLRKFDDPPFGTVREVVDFVRQILQVIQNPWESPRSTSDTHILAGNHFLARLECCSPVRLSRHVCIVLMRIHALIQ
jgi:hypothetical protein